jgi:negative regulator of replication initiation
MQTIEVDDDVMTALKAEAEPFADTPNSVLRRILGLHKASLATLGAGKTKSHSDTERSSEGNPARARAGTILPQEEYMLPLLEVLQQHGGRAPAREVVEEVGQRMADRLTTLDKEVVQSGEVRWRNRVQFARLRLVDRGLLKKNSPRGLWEITKEGENYFRVNSKFVQPGSRPRARIKYVNGLPVFDLPKPKQLLTTERVKELEAEEP